MREDVATKNWKNGLTGLVKVTDEIISDGDKGMEGVTDSSKKLQG